MQAYRITKLGIGFAAIMVNVNSDQEQMNRNQILRDGGSVMYCNDIEDAAYDLATNLDNITVVEATS